MTERAGGSVLPLGTFVLLGALAAFPPVTIDTYLPALPALARDLGATPAAGQLTLTACMLGLGLGQLVLGPLSDAFGRRRPLLVALVPFVLASAACALAPRIEVLVACRFVQGFSAASGLLTAQAVARDRAEGTGVARILASLVLVSGLAPILAPSAGAWVLGAGGSWRAVFWLLALVVSALFVVVALRFEESLPPERRRPASPRAVLRGFRALAADRAFVAHALTSAGAAGALFTYIAGSPFVLQDVRGLPPPAFAAAFSANAVGLVVVSQIGARLVHRVGSRALVWAGLALLALGALATTFVLGVDAPTALLLPSLGVMLSGVGLVFPHNVALALRPHAGAAATAAAGLGLSQYASGGVAAPLYGLGLAHGPVTWGALMLGWSCLAAAAFAFSSPSATAHPPASAGATTASA